MGARSWLTTLVRSTSPYSVRLRWVLGFSLITALLLGISFIVRQSGNLLVSDEDLSHTDLAYISKWTRRAKESQVSGYVSVRCALDEIRINPEHEYEFTQHANMKLFGLVFFSVCCA